MDRLLAAVRDHVVLRFWFGKYKEMRPVRQERIGKR
jgi:hypothetical protein